MHADSRLFLRPVTRWAHASEQDFVMLGQRTPSGHPVGCYGTGYNSWGVQTNQKYMAAMAALATLDAGSDSPVSVDRGWALERAMASLRFSLQSHHSGSLTCTDGTRWGHTWISALGIERMMFAIQLLHPHLDEPDHQALRRVLTSESEWIAGSLERGGQKGIVADRWAGTGRNVPESNLWNGCILWRTAVMYPDAPGAATWRDVAHRLLVNSVSVASDVGDPRILEAKPIRDWYVGANFFPSYALDHHGYLNVGYMVICTSNAAMLHFDLKTAGLPRPSTLDHHQADLWQAIRRMIFSDGRLARIGGDSRVRYAYCQEYLLPAALYAADHLGDPHALDLARRQVAFIEREQGEGCGGYFYARRLRELRSQNPYYHTRLESDRACALAMAAAWSGLVDAPPAKQDFESSVAGSWVEHEHGAVLHRSPRRFASFAWRAQGLTQALCLPPDRSDLAEWSQNMAGCVRFAGDEGFVRGGQTRHRQLLRHHIAAFDGGFATCGSIREGMNLELPEGWKGSGMATHHLALFALPDGHTMVGIQFAIVDDKRAVLAELKGLRFNLPNDLFNDSVRSLQTQCGSVVLHSPPAADEVLVLNSRWANVDGRIGIVGISGAGSLSVSRSSRRRGGAYRSLYVEEVCWHCETVTRMAEPGEVMLDVSWAVLSGVDAADTGTFAAANRHAGSAGLLRWVEVQGADGQGYLAIANFGDAPTELPREVRVPAAPEPTIAAGEARLVKL